MKLFMKPFLPATQTIAVRALSVCAMTGNIPSPCISVCRLDNQNGLCEGCLRTLDEIRDWSSYHDLEKKRVWGRIAQRDTLQPMSEKP